MEMNTRIQVEHPVTEVTTGFDLSRSRSGWRLESRLPHRKGVEHRVHAIEFRINAEDPDRNFAPGPGTITTFHPPGRAGCAARHARLSGYKVPPNYDSLLAKLIVSGNTREESDRAGRHVLDHMVIEGIPTTIPFLRRIVDDRYFVAGDVDTGLWLA